MAQELTLRRSESNRQVAIEEVASRIARELKKGVGSSRDSLLSHVAVGAALIEFKELTPHGEFIHQIGVRFGLQKQWSARLMKLSVEWPNIRKAIEWAEATGQMTRSEYSVDGAFALLAKWRYETAEDEPGSPRPRGSDHRRPQHDAVKPVNLLQFLLMALAALAHARARILLLEAEVERLKSEAFVNVHPTHTANQPEKSRDWTFENPGLGVPSE